MESLKEKLLAMAAQLTECAHNLDQYSEVSGEEAEPMAPGAEAMPAEAPPVKNMEELKKKASKFKI